MVPVYGHSPVSALVLRPAVRVASGCTLADAVDLMGDAGVSALLLEDAQSIVTKGDIARAVARGQLVTTPVEHVATAQPVVIPDTTTVVDACARMLNEGIRQLVVHSDSGLALLSVSEVAAVLLQTCEHRLWFGSVRFALDVPPSPPRA
jgi:CBS domain-containing protein